MPKKTIIFDFDGTIADTLEKTVEIINGLSEEFGYQKITEKNIRELKDKSFREILDHGKISMAKLPFIVRKVRTELNKEIEFLKPFSGIREVLLKLKEKGYKIGILTSNSEENVLKFLKKNNLDIFDFLYTASSIFGKDRTMKKFLIKHNFSPEQVVYIGDEVRDAQAAKKNKVDIILVSWGMNSRQVLGREKPYFLIDKPSEIIKILENHM